MGQRVGREAPSSGPGGGPTEEPSPCGDFCWGWGAGHSPLCFPSSLRSHLLLSFQVSKKYSDIEEFYQKLSGRYPTASLPPLPRKVLFVGEGDIRERRALFDEILRCISKDAELAGSPELLEFLGT